MTQGWLAVVSAAHVRRGCELGIVQVNHGKRAPLARMRAGDSLIYYSPSEERGGTPPLQRFTAFAEITDDEIWQADEGGFCPFRRRARYLNTATVHLDEVRAELHLTQNPHWGYLLRRGVLQLDAHDTETLRAIMGA